MKNVILKSTFIFSFLFITSNHIIGQTKRTFEEDGPNKFEFVVVAKLGTLKYQETGNVALNGFTNSADILFSKKINKKINISTGIGLIEFDGNRIALGTTSSIKNTYLHLPLNLKSNINIFKDKADSNIFLSVGLGLYGNTLLKQTVETTSGNFNDKNLGWNIGFSTQLGIKFKASDKLNLGVGYESQSDLFKMKKNNIERKIEASNSIYFSFGLIL